MGVPASFLRNTYTMTHCSQLLQVGFWRRSTQAGEWWARQVSNLHLLGMNQDHQNGLWSRFPYFVSVMGGQFGSLQLFKVSKACHGMKRALPS